MRIFAVTILSFFATFSFAEMLEVEYASFYSHLKKIDDQDTQALQFAFGFKNIHSQSLCEIKEAKIVTPKVTIPVSVSNENRFTLPTEKALKQARATLHVDLVEQANQCDLSVQLETKAEYLNTTYTAKVLSEILAQYEVFFDNVGGFMSFLMPDVTGLQLHFSEALPNHLANDISGDDKHLYLSKDGIGQMNTLTLPWAPFRITATTE